MDPASARAVTRVLLFLVFAVAWCGLIHLATGRPVTPVPLLMAAFAAAIAFALRQRDRPWGEVLNHWDEALAFLGLASLARLLWGVP